EFEAQGFGSLLLPEECGGAGGTLTDAALVLEEIHAAGGNAQPFHGQYYLSFLVSRFASDPIRQKYLPDLARGDLRMQSFALTEPDAGSDLTRITTFAEHEGDRYRIRGRKVFISRVEQSDLMVLVARTSPLEEGAKRTEGLSLFLVDLREAKGIGHTPIRTMFNSQTYELSLDDLEVPAENRIGEEGKGFGVLVHVLNPERILIASECLGDARWFIDRSATPITCSRARGHIDGSGVSIYATKLPAVRPGEHPADDREGRDARHGLDRVRFGRWCTARGEGVCPQGPPVLDRGDRLGASGD